MRCARIALCARGLVSSVFAPVPQVHLAGLHKLSGNVNNLKLRELLEALVKDSIPSNDDRNKRLRVINELQQSLQKANLGPTIDLRILPFGSFVNSLYERSSDLDVAIVGNIVATDDLSPEDKRFPFVTLQLAKLPRDYTVELLRTAVARFVKDGLVEEKSLVPVLHARIPIIKFVHPATGISVDVTVGSDGDAFKTWSMGQLMALHPAADKLFRVVKVWARAHCINDPRSFTFNTWCLTLLRVENLMSMVSKNVVPARESFGCRKAKPLDQLFLQFLDSNSKLLKAALCNKEPLKKGTAISVFYGDFHRDSHFAEHRLFVEDPLNSLDNTARTLRAPKNSGRTLDYVTKTFTQSAMRLRAHLNGPTTGSARPSSEPQSSTKKGSPEAGRAQTATNEAVPSGSSPAAPSKAPAAASTPPGAGTSSSPAASTEGGAAVAAAAPAAAGEAGAEAAAVTPGSAPSSPSSVVDSSLAATAAFLFGTELITRLPELSAKVLGRELCDWVRGELAAGQPVGKVHEELLKKLGAAGNFEPFVSFKKRRKIRVLDEEEQWTSEEIKLLIDPEAGRKVWMQGETSGLTAQRREPEHKQEQEHGRKGRLGAQLPTGQVEQQQQELHGAKEVSEPEPWRREKPQGKEAVVGKRGGRAGVEAPSAQAQPGVALAVLPRRGVAPKSAASRGDRPDKGGAVAKGQQLAAQLANLNPDDLVNTLKTGRYTTTATEPLPAPPGTAPTRIRHPHHADTATGEVTHITPELLLATCRELRKRLLMDRSFHPTHIVQLIELLAAHCGNLDGDEAAAAARDLLSRHRGCSQALLAAQRSPEQAELAGMLPRLIPALVALEFDDKARNAAVWGSIFRVMHSSLESYSGEQVAALVGALVELDSAITSTSLEGSSSSGNSSSTGFGSQQLQQPSMSRRLEELACRGGASGDALAGVLMSLVSSGLKQVSMDQAAVLIRRALQADGLTPQGCCHLLRAAAWMCNRIWGSSTEVMSQLSRYEANLIPLLANKLADHAAAGRLTPPQFTDAAQSFVQLRFLQPNFVAELAAATIRGIRTGQVKRRDISVALYTCAYFGCREVAAADLFAAAAASLESRLTQDRKPVSLTRLAWSYAVAGACGLLPQRRADRKLVNRFLQKLLAALQSRFGAGDGGGSAPGEEVGISTEAAGQLKFALQIWGVLEPSLATPELLKALDMNRHHRHHHQPDQEQGPQQPQSPPGRRTASAAAVLANEVTHISDLQRDVYRQLVALGYRPRMEERVGFWTVDILFRVGARPVAVEVDGPTHFTTCHHRQPLGTSLARDECLRRLGLAVVALSFRDYRQCLKPATSGGGGGRGLPRDGRGSAIPEYLQLRVEQAVALLDSGGGGGGGGGALAAARPNATRKGANSAA
ncbi:hypothetical protein VOLCADRAFT_102845 [Volvox carteri f. nagariensis]|uniref:Poly(A) RNA polymerase mitochondrial-like central palm domain-containing protein n=1 Tax=Volvox carteri f. nagariensis TaxID=3068 RepID=D8TIG3_VOLCA|nr:uncharacterized protein VOLCADRAFT_102845 [Volvox carteri f. nagariensis]EFJ53236.1 hypothetical protein VOLCADRAFT_102845 [Volvox carteri f. nagariensis]|eukprot:XP_002946241.1 hypothetical protein VOLCADRAFT_102845 [Volvox carteri f. nagariensis]